MILPCITAKLAASMPPSAVVNICENLKLQEKSISGSLLSALGNF
jgi:hypothetical protein|tara:strand:+ start:1237 stop:1371 length:135 start_codon:yes stop_codon:yes gene_type:complete